MSYLTHHQPGEIVVQQATSDDHLIELWLSTFTSAATQKAYTRALVRLRRWLQGKPLRSVTASDLINYRATFPEDWSDASSNQQLAAIKSLWSFGCELQYFAFNVPHACYKLSKPRPVTAERILTDREMKRAIKLEPNREIKLFLRLLYSTGLRAAEAIALCWGDLHQRGSRVYLQVQAGKGNKFREIGCPVQLYRELVEIRGRARDADRIFPVSYMTVYRWVKLAMLRIGKPEASPHWARHAHAVVSHENGADWHSIARQLGHSQASFTMDRYGHFNGEPSSDFVDC